MAAGEEVAEFMREKNREQRQSKRQPLCERGGVFVEERERTAKFVERGCLIVCESNRELRPRDQARAKRREEQDASQEQTLC